jgi:glutathione peroxidase
VSPGPTGAHSFRIFGFQLFVRYMASEFYQLSANNPQGHTISMSDFEGKVILVVNTATKCGLTPQFEGLEHLYQQYKEKGLVILGFPCNQFAGQEPETNEHMQQYCQLNHGVTFPLFEKIEVNGGNTHPIFKMLKRRLGGFFGSRIKWNFTKFLVDASGRPVRRFSPVTKPEAIEPFIRKLLSAQPA